MFQLPLAGGEGRCGAGQAEDDHLQADHVAALGDNPHLGRSRQAVASCRDYLSPLHCRLPCLKFLFYLSLLSAVLVCLKCRQCQRGLILFVRIFFFLKFLIVRLTDTPAAFRPE